MTGLERRYRRLLRSYPRWYRESRGAEMVTTLLDAADARGKSSTWEEVGIVLRGLRLRLAAGSLSTRALAAATAVTVGVLGAVAGAVAGWQTAADLPNQPRAAAIAETAMSDAESFASLEDLFGWEGYDAESRPDPAFGGLFAGGDEYSAGFHRFTVEHETPGLTPLHEAKNALSAAGWQVGPVSRNADGGEFTANRDGLTLVAETQVGGETSDILIERAQPIAVPVLAVAGFALGALLGWIVMVWADHRMAHWGGIRKSVVAKPLAAVGLLLALPTLYNLVLTVAALSDPTRAIPIWHGYVWGPPGLLTVLALVALGVAVAKTAAAFSRRPQSAAEPALG